MNGEVINHRRERKWRYNPEEAPYRGREGTGANQAAAQRRAWGSPRRWHEERRAPSRRHSRRGRVLRPRALRFQEQRHRAVV